MLLSDYFMKVILGLTKYFLKAKTNNTNLPTALYLSTKYEIYKKEKKT